jgi:hypothetical protein
MGTLPGVPSIACKKAGHLKGTRNIKCPRLQNDLVERKTVRPSCCLNPKVTCLTLEQVLCPPDPNGCFWHQEQAIKANKISFLTTISFNYSYLVWSDPNGG